jgi:hypothetical protein
MTKQAANSNSGSYYDEVFRRIQDMERRQFEDENNRNWNDYLKDYKPSNNFNMFAHYGFEVKSETVNA